MPTGARSDGPPQSPFPVSGDAARPRRVGPALQSAHLEGNSSAKTRTFTGPSVLVVDELGYLPMDQTSAHWIFQVVSRRYERGSIVLTSNRGFSDWGQVFADQVVAAAILDRLLHHATVVNIKGVKAGRKRQRWPVENDSTWGRMLTGSGSSFHSSWRVCRGPLLRTRFA